MTTKEKIEVMQAYLDGKQIQFREFPLNGREKWMDLTGEPAWKWGTYEYRIKPEPRIPIEEWRVLYKDGSWSPSYGIARVAKAVFNATSGAERVVHFREVIEDDQSQSEA